MEFHDAFGVGMGTVIGGILLGLYVGWIFFGD